MIDIVILDHAKNEVVFVKEDEKVIEEKYDNNLELYLQGYLMYRLSEISWMCASELKCTMFNGGPFGGTTVTYDDYWDEL